MTVPKEVGRFADLTRDEEDEKLYNALWEFFNEPPSIIRLHTATYLKRPAIEALQPSIEERFEKDFKMLDDKKFNRFKMAMGRMVRLILVGTDEAPGEYDIDQRDVRIRRGLFSKATRYKLNPKTNDVEISK